MHRITFWVDGVRGQARPRHTKSGHVYTTGEDAEYREKVRQAYIEAGGYSFDDCPIMVNIKVYRPLPKSRPKSAQDEAQTVKPDADNIAKIVCDALNGLAYDDDKQVTYLVVDKRTRRRGQMEGIEVSIGDDKRGR